MRSSSKMGRINKMGSCRKHHLPEEIIQGILVKLPLKSIIRFQSVSKSFLNLIRSRRFIDKHLIETDESFLAICLVVCEIGSEHLDRLFLSLCSYDDHSDKWPVRDFDLLHSGTRSNLYLVGHCNGIMCLTNYEVIMLINPSLAEVKLLPIPDSDEDDFKLVGFGFDNMTMDFKVVTVMALGSGEVYSLSSNSWRELDEIPVVVVDDSTHCSTFFNGVVHWCIETTGVEGEPSSSLSWRILTFNLATELFHQMEFPQGWCTNIANPVPSLFVLNQESIAFVSYGYSTPFVNVWTMNKHGTEQTWTKLYSIGPLLHFSKPLSFLREHKFLYKADNGKIILYDILNHSSSIVCDYRSQFPSNDDSHCFSLCLEMGVCKSSLVSIL